MCQVSKVGNALARLLKARENALLIVGLIIDTASNQQGVRRQLCNLDGCFHSLFGCNASGKKEWGISRNTRRKWYFTNIQAIINNMIKWCPGCIGASAGV